MFNRMIKTINKPFLKIGKAISTVDWKNVQIDTYLRYFFMLLTIVNTILIHLGKNPIPYSEEDIYKVLSDIATMFILMINTYKDNPTSKESIECTEMQRVMKASEDLSDIKNLLEAKLEEIKEIETEKNIELEDDL